MRSPIIALLIKWSGIGITDGRNKIGGTVLSKSRSGATARNKVTPINRRSSFQSAIRSVFTGFSQSFSALTRAQILAWNNAANSGFTTTNIFGDAVKKSGKALYTALNINLNKIGFASISNPPSSTDTPALVLNFEPTSDVSSANIIGAVTFDSGSAVVPADSAVLYYATPPMSPGVSYVKSQLRVFSLANAGDDTSAQNLLTAYVTRFGSTPAVGDNVVLAMQVVNSVSGIGGTPWQASLAIVP